MDSQARVSPCQQLVHQTREKSLAEESHERLPVPVIEALECAIWGKATVGHENVTVAIPLQEISSRRDADHDSRADVRAKLPARVLRQCFGGTLAQIE